MADFEQIRLEVDGAVATIVIDRPKVLNALSSATTEEIGAALERIAADDDIRAVVVRGAGDKAFVAGADINELATFGPIEGREASATGQKVFDRIERFPKPVIAAVNGYALGGGCELALACHIRIASDRAQLGLPEINLAIIPGHGGTQRLPRLVGKAKALELICSGERVDAAEAERIGLVNRVVPHEELDETVGELAKQLASKPPIALRYCLEAVQQGLEAGMDEGEAIEADLFGLCCATEDQKEGMNAFLEKREPEWKGR